MTMLDLSKLTLSELIELMKELSNEIELRVMIREGE